MPLPGLRDLRLSDPLGARRWPLEGESRPQSYNHRFVGLEGGYFPVKPLKEDTAQPSP